jgi:hypothetical protein
MKIGPRKSKLKKIRKMKTNTHRKKSTEFNKSNSVVATASLFVKFERNKYLTTVYLFFR